jgi:4'-phosphopantetheinyl transferase
MHRPEHRYYKNRWQWGKASAAEISAIGLREVSMVGKSSLRLDWLGASCEEVPHPFGEGISFWRIDLPMEVRQVTVPDRLICAQDQARAGRLRDALERFHFTASQAVLRSVLSALGCGPEDRIQIVRDGRGKPCLAGNGLRFSLSRSGAAVLIGVSYSREIGVDIECMRYVPNLEALARNQLSAAEFAVWRQACAEARNLNFLRYWTRKEACVKAAGVGLAVPLADIHVGCEVNGISHRVTLHHSGAAWTVQVASLQTEQNVIAAAAVVE